MIKGLEHLSYEEKAKALGFYYYYFRFEKWQMVKMIEAYKIMHAMDLFLPLL